MDIIIDNKMQQDFEWTVENHAMFSDMIYLDNISNAFDIYSEVLSRMYNLPVKATKIMLQRLHDKTYFYMDIDDFAYCLALQNVKPERFTKQVSEEDVKFIYRMLIRYRYLFSQGLASDNEKQSIYNLILNACRTSLNALAYTFMKTKHYHDIISHIHNALSYYSSLHFSDDEADELAKMLMEKSKIELTFHDDIKREVASFKILSVVISYGFTVDFHDIPKELQNDLIRKHIIAKLNYNHDGMLIKGNDNYEVNITKTITIDLNEVLDMLNHT